MYCLKTYFMSPYPTMEMSRLKQFILTCDVSWEINNYFFSLSYGVTFGENIHNLTKNIKLNKYQKTDYVANVVPHCRL